MKRFRWLLILVSAVALVFQGLVPAQAAEVVPAPFVASDYLSGLAQARLRDHRVLIISEPVELQLDIASGAGGIDRALTR